MSSNVTKLPRAHKDALSPHPLSVQEAMERAAESRLKTTLIAGVASFVWVLLCLIYAFAHIGGERLASLAPHEAGASSAGVALPLVV
ncbi:MAG: hypothetical protein OEZ03_10250, partial [Alphaproteobacteria bacterium]|nr:hypothetical protein [Alphaproteobacteria bacterium]